MKTELTDSKKATLVQGSKLARIGSLVCYTLEFFCSSLEFLQGALRCTDFYWKHLQLQVAIGLPRKKHLISSPAC